MAVAARPAGAGAPAVTSASPRRLVRAFPLLMVGLAGLTFALAVVYLGFGTLRISPGDVVAALAGEPRRAFHSTIVVDNRLPAGLIAVVAGAMMGLAGALLQSVLRNPLTDPTTTGVTGGAVLGLVLATLALGVVSGPLLPAIALAGAVPVGALVYWMGRRRDGRTDPIRLLLAGVLMGSVCVALTMAVLIFSGENAQGAFFFYVVGSLNARTWPDWNTLWPWALVTLPLALACASRANVLHFSDGVGISLGLDIERVRLSLLVMATLLTVGAVSAVGGLTFIGFLAPHLARRLVGDDARRLFPASAVLGALVLVSAGLVTKLVSFDFAPDDGEPPLGIPVGAVVALLGAPLLLTMLLRRNRVD